MNPRIRELLLKAGWDGYEALDERNQKFAELIVRECITVLDQDDGATHHSELLLEHFGVEE